MAQITPLLILNILLILVNCQSDDEARRLNRRRPGQQYQSGNPCGRFLGLSYINLNYHFDCGGGYDHNYGASNHHDSLIGQGQGGHHQGHHMRPQKPHRPQHQPGGGFQGNFFDRPFFMGLGNLATGLGTFGNNLASNFNNGPPGGGNFFDGFDGSSILQSFTSLFSGFGGLGGALGSGSSSSPPVVAPVRPIRPPGTTTIAPHPVVPIVDARPVHEYYDDVSETVVATNKLPYYNRFHPNGNSRYKRDIFRTLFRAQLS